MEPNSLKLLRKEDLNLKFKRTIIALAYVAFFSSLPHAMAWDQHTVGWFGAFVPGGSEFALGNYDLGVRNALVVTSTFGIGYALSSRSELTLDGVPLDFPGVTSRVVSHCSSVNGHQVCSQSSQLSLKATDATRANLAALLQEFGLKYHMSNAFDGYRRAQILYGGDVGQGIDERPMSELFQDPIRGSTLSSPWVWGPLLLVAGGLVYDYSSQLSAGLPQTQKLNTISNSFMAFNQAVMYPIGSGAPEEMFYRGFVQNEAYSLVPSPYFSIAMSSILFGFSHGPEERLAASLFGSYLGMLTYKDHGELAEPIAVHFWTVFLLGVESIFLTLHSQVTARPIALQLNFGI